MTRARKALIVAAALAASVLVLGYWFAWREGAETLRRAIDTWADGQRSSGLAVVYDDVKAGGFPFLVRGNVDDFSIGDGRTWRWSAATLRVDTFPHDLDRLVFSATNPQALDLGRHGLWALTARQGRVGFTENAGEAWRLAVRSGPGALARADGSMTLRSERFDLAIAPTDPAARRIDARLEIDGLSVARRGATIDAPRLVVAIETSEDGPGGREITLKQLLLEAEGATAEIEGVVRIDAAGYPEGLLQAEIANPAGFAALLAKLGALDAREAEVAGASLALAAIASGGKLRGPIHLENGEARIAGAKIANLPRID